MSDEAFQEFVLARGPELTRFATLLCRNRTEAEDLVQDTLASAYASWRRIEATASPEAYVRRMLVNRHVSWWRRHRGRVEPRAVLAEFGTVIPEDIEIRVSDSTAMVRYLVLPRRPDGTDGMDEESLAALVTRDAMIGVVPVAAPTGRKVQ